MEETERAKQNFAASKIAGVETSSNKIPAPPNYAWPTPSNIEVSNRNLSFDDVHTEYRDNYLKWAVEKVCNHIIFVIISIGN